MYKLQTKHMFKLQTNPAEYLKYGVFDWLKHMCLYVNWNGYTVQVIVVIYRIG